MAIFLVFLECKQQTAHQITSHHCTTVNITCMFLLLHTETIAVQRLLEINAGVNAINEVSSLE